MNISAKIPIRITALRTHVMTPIAHGRPSIANLAIANTSANRTLTSKISRNEKRGKSIRFPKSCDHALAPDYRIFLRGCVSTQTSFFAVELGPRPVALGTEFSA